MQNQNFNPPSTPTGNTENQSRPSSVNSIANPPTPNQNFQQQQNAVYTTVSSANFSPSSNAGNYVNANSGNDKPGYPQVNSSPQLTSHNSSGYSGQEQYSGHPHENHWQAQQQQMMWEQQTHQDKVDQQNQYQEQVQQATEHYAQHQQDVNSSPNKMDNLHNVQSAVKTFSQADKVNLNTRIKTMILNKQQETKIDEPKPVEQNTTGHFLWYSHHPHLDPLISGDGGPLKTIPDQDLKTDNVSNQSLQNFRLETTSQRPVSNEFNSHSHMKNEIKQEQFFRDGTGNDYMRTSIKKELNVEIKQENIKEEHILDSKNGIKEEKNNKIGCEIPQCGCFPPDQSPPEPGTYYTHLGTSKHSLVNVPY